MLQNCDVDFVLSAGIWPAERTLALVQNANARCNSTSPNYSPTLFGTFDKNREVLDAIDSVNVLFAISQQRHLQAVVPVVLASLYVTTGKLLSPTTDSSTGLTTGPVMVDAETRASHPMPKPTSYVYATTAVHTNNVDIALGFPPFPVARDGICNNLLITF